MINKFPDCSQCKFSKLHPKHYLKSIYYIWKGENDELIKSKMCCSYNDFQGNKFLTRKNSELCGPTGKWFKPKNPFSYFIESLLNNFSNALRSD